MADNNNDIYKAIGGLESSMDSVLDGMKILGAQQLQTYDKVVEVRNCNQKLHTRVDDQEEIQGKHGDLLEVLKDNQKKVIWGAAGFSAAVSGMVAIMTWFLK